MPWTSLLTKPTYSRAAPLTISVHSRLITLADTMHTSLLDAGANYTICVNAIPFYSVA